MSSVYIIKNITQQHIWYESSLHLLGEIHRYVEPQRVPFFTDYEFEPDDNDHQHVLDGAALARQLIIILTAFHAASNQQTVDPSTPLLMDLCNRMLESCRDHPDHLWTCYLFD